MCNNSSFFYFFSFLAISSFFIGHFSLLMTQRVGSTALYTNTHTPTHAPLCKGGQGALSSSLLQIGFSQVTLPSNVIDAVLRPSPIPLSVYTHVYIGMHVCVCVTNGALFY